MSIWDTDKDSVNRTSPKLNQKDQLLQRVAQGVTSLNAVTDTTPGSVTTSTFGVFKIVKVMDLTLSFTGITFVASTWQTSSNSISTAHGLGYTPTPFAFFNGTNNFSPIPVNLASVSAGGPFWTEYDISVNSTHVTLTGRLVSYNQGVLSSDKPVRVYLCKERPG